MIMTQEELTNTFKYIVKKCDMLINNGDYEADAYTQDTVEDIAELCNHILDGDYGKLVEAKEVNLEKEIKDYFNNQPIITRSKGVDYQLIPSGEEIAKHFFEFGKNVSNPLTWRDIAEIDKIVSLLETEWLNGTPWDGIRDWGFYQEVLNRFKVQKGE